jgi:hypothetical protein
MRIQTEARIRESASVQAGILAGFSPVLTRFFEGTAQTPAGTVDQEKFYDILADFLLGLGSDDELFALRYLAEYGHRPEQGSIEVESIRVLVGATSGEDFPLDLATHARPPVTGDRRRARFAQEWVEVPLRERSHLAAGEVELDAEALAG